MKVVGTYYYQAAEAHRLGLLYEGSQITLGADIDNEYDKYAVVVSIKSFRLGHISKELEKAYAGYDYHGRYREIINEKDRLIEEKNKEILRRKEQVEHLDQLIVDISTNGDGVDEYKS